MPDEYLMNWELAYRDSLENNRLCRLTCGVGYGIDMAIVVGALNARVCYNGNPVVTLEFHQRGISYFAINEQWELVARQLMILYAEKIKCT